MEFWNYIAIQNRTVSIAASSVLTITIFLSVFSVNRFECIPKFSTNGSSNLTLSNGILMLPMTLQILNLKCLHEN